LQDTLDKFALKEDVEKVKRCTRLNAYAHDKVEQYTRREIVRISGLKLDREANITTKVLDLFNRFSRIAGKDKVKFLLVVI